MANANVKYGFEFYKNLYGGGPAQTIECEALVGYDVEIHVGDTVHLGGDASPPPNSHRPSVIIGTAGAGKVYGVISSIYKRTPDALETWSGQKKTKRIVTVIPALEGYIFKANASDGVNPTDMGAMFDSLLGTPSNPSGRSGMEVDTNTGVSTSAVMLLLGFDNVTDNEFTGAGSSTDTTGVDCLIKFHESHWLVSAGV